MKNDDMEATKQAAKKIPDIVIGEADKEDCAKEVIAAYNRAKNPGIMKKWQVKVIKSEVYYVEVLAEGRKEAKELALLDKNTKSHNKFFVRCHATPM